MSVKIIIRGDDRVLSAKLSIFDIAAILSARISEINSGSPVYIVDDKKFNPKQLAIEEIIQGKCPLSLERHVNANIFEEWDVNEMYVDVKFSDLL